MEGLVEYYAAALRDRPVIVHCNLLWMTSPKADLSTDEGREVQSSPPGAAVPAADIPATGPTRPRGWAWWPSATWAFSPGWSTWRSPISARRAFPAGRWKRTTASRRAARTPGATRLSQITLAVPGEPQRRPATAARESPRHKPWTAGGGKPTRFDWVGLDQSLQWQAFQRIRGAAPRPRLRRAGDRRAIQRADGRPRAAARLSQAPRRHCRVAAATTSSPASFPRPCRASSMPTPATRSPRVTPCWRKKSAGMRRSKNGIIPSSVDSRNSRRRSCATSSNSC